MTTIDENNGWQQWMKIMDDNDYWFKASGRQIPVGAISSLSPESNKKTLFWQIYLILWNYLLKLFIGNTPTEPSETLDGFHEFFEQSCMPSHAMLRWVGIQGQSFKLVLFCLICSPPILSCLNNYCIFLLIFFHSFWHWNPCICFNHLNFEMVRGNNLMIFAP